VLQHQIRSIERQRVAMYKQMRLLRKELHAMVLQQHSLLAGAHNATVAGVCEQLQQQQQQQGAGQGTQGAGQQQLQLDSAKRVVLLLGGVDDVVRPAAAAAGGQTVISVPACLCCVLTLPVCAACLCVSYAAMLHISEF
jgi:hypothetical protein